MRRMWIIWNVDAARPVGAPFKRLRKAIAAATALEIRDDEHHAVLPAR